MNLDFLIIGQGVSGSVLHYYMTHAGLNGVVMDRGIKNSASDVAAGIVNPVTGKRFVKSWKFEDLDPEARKYYKTIGQVLGHEYLIETPIFRILHTTQMTNSWDSKISQPEYKKYLNPHAEIGDYKKIINPDLFIGETSGSYRIKTSRFINDYRNHLENSSSLIEDTFSEDKLIQKDGMWEYEGMKFTHLIYANGYRASTSRFWQYLPFNLSKAEILVADQKGLDLNGIMKHKLFVVPLADKSLWIGASNEWDFSDGLPTEKGKNDVIKSFSLNYNMDLDILNHRAAIRPTTDDRRPFIGSHHAEQNLHLFNGMGTKGFLMAPYLANELVAKILENKELDEEIDIKRFES